MTSPEPGASEEKIAHAAERLTTLRDAMLKLPSLRPGEGYDAIGRELCALIFDAYTPAEKDAILKRLDPQTVSDIRRISIASEMEMERKVIDTIAAMTEEERRPPATGEKNRIAHFRHIARSYPYSWGFSRAQEQRELIERMESRELSPATDAFLFHGRTMLPWSGLSLHMLTNIPVVWIDRFDDSAACAQRLVAILEDINILDKGSLRIVSENDGEAVKSALASLTGKTIHSFALDKDYDITPIYKRFHSLGVASLMLTQTHGLTRLLYPPYDLDALKDLFNLKAVLVPPHARGTENIPAGTVVIDGTRPDVFLSTMFFRPT